MGARGNLRLRKWSEQPLPVPSPTLRVAWPFPGGGRTHLWQHDGASVNHFVVSSPGTTLVPSRWRAARRGAPLRLAHATEQPPTLTRFAKRIASKSSRFSTSFVGSGTTT